MKLFKITQVRHKVFRVLPFYRLTMILIYTLYDSTNHTYYETLPYKFYELMYENNINVYSSNHINKQNHQKYFISLDLVFLSIFYICMYSQ